MFRESSVFARFIALRIESMKVSGRKLEMDLGGVETTQEGTTQKAAQAQSICKTYLYMLHFK